MELYIHQIPVFVVNEPDEGVDLPEFCQEAQDLLSPHLLRNVEVVYIGEFKELQGRNATYANGAIYIASAEPTAFDMLEDFIHEVAHSLESSYGLFIYDDALVAEFKGI